MSMEPECWSNEQRYDVEGRQKSPFLWAIAIPPIYPSSQAFWAAWPPG